MTLHHTLELGILFGYFTIMLAIVCFSYKKQQSGADFILGNRKANFWLTALSAQASDMGSWLFLGYPALIFEGGVFAAWSAIGLILGMFFNWHFIAPRLRSITGQFNSLTLNAYFETRFQDSSGLLRYISALMSAVFFTIYIASGLMATGVLLESLFGLDYHIGATIGLFIVITYVFMGGYRTVAWIDLFQGFFLLGVIICIPLYLMDQIGGVSSLWQKLHIQKISTSLFPDMRITTLWSIVMTAAGWGLGYFGQPHILTKFMGIRHSHEMWKAKYVGLSWLVIALSAVTFTGLIGTLLFQHSLTDPQQVILHIVRSSLSPFFAGLVLCAILAATTNVMAAHILIVASNLSEDFYHRLLHKTASPKELLWISRLSVLAVGCISMWIAYFKPNTIYHLVLYAWSGLGASFGPLVLLSLYSKRLNRYGAFGGIFIGGATAAIWPYINQLYQWEVAPIVPGFILGLVAIQGISLWTRESVKSIA